MITTTTRRLQSRLVTLADLKVAIVPGDSNDVYLASLIDRVTSFIESRCRRRFGREVVVETFNGNSKTTKMMSRFPLVDLGALTLTGSVVATSEYEIYGDGASGLVFMGAGWIENFTTRTLIERTYLPQAADGDYSLTYTYGYLLPSDDIVVADSFTDCAVDASAKTFTRTSGKWPLLVDGDRCTFGGFADSGLNIEYTVASRTDLVITVDETPTATEAAGETITLSCKTLPAELEQVAIDMVNFRFQGRSRDKSIKQEKIGDWSGTYGENKEFNEVISRYEIIL